MSEELNDLVSEINLYSCMLPDNNVVLGIPEFADNDYIELRYPVLIDIKTNEYSCWFNNSMPSTILRYDDCIAFEYIDAVDIKKRYHQSLLTYLLSRSDPCLIAAIFYPSSLSSY